MAYIKAKSDKKGNASVSVDGSGLELLALLTATVDTLKDMGMLEPLIKAAVQLGIEGSEGIKRKENA